MCKSRNFMMYLVSCHYHSSYWIREFHHFFHMRQYVILPHLNMFPKLQLSNHMSNYYSSGSLLVLCLGYSSYWLLCCHHFVHRALYDLGYHQYMFPNFLLSKYRSNCYSSELYLAWHHYNTHHLLFHYCYFCRERFDTVYCLNKSPNHLYTNYSFDMLVYCMFDS